MKFETQFKLGDSVFVLYENMVYNVEVIGIEVFITEKNSGVNYVIRFPSGGQHRCSEERLFPTKQELLDTL